MKKVVVKKENNMKDVSLLELLKNGVHFGHQRSRWHPKMEPYIYMTRNGVHIINLEKTAEGLKVALEFLKGVAASGGIILFVGTKRQAKDIVQKYAKQVKMPYLTERWIGGILTNFPVIHQLIKKLRKLKSDKESGELQKYTKKEQLEFQKEIETLEKLVGGIESLEKLPQALFIIDVKKEKTAVREAVKVKIPITALVDTNNNPADVNYVIPANNDATKSIEYITSLVADSIKEGIEQRNNKQKNEEIEGGGKEKGK